MVFLLVVSVGRRIFGTGGSRILDRVVISISYNTCLRIRLPGVYPKAVFNMLFAAQTSTTQSTSHFRIATQRLIQQLHVTQTLRAIQKAPSSPPPSSNRAPSRPPDPSYKPRPKHSGIPPQPHFHPRSSRPESQASSACARYKP